MGHKDVYLDWLILGGPAVGVPALLRQWVTAPDFDIVGTTDVQLASARVRLGDGSGRSAFLRLWAPRTVADLDLESFGTGVGTVVVVFDADVREGLAEALVWAARAREHVHAEAQFVLLAHYRAPGERAIPTPQGVHAALREGHLYYEVDGAGPDAPARARLALGLLAEGTVGALDAGHWSPAHFEALGVRFLAGEEGGLPEGRRGGRCCC